MGAGHVAVRTAHLLRSATAAVGLAAAVTLSSAAESGVRSSDGRWILRADNDACVLLAIDAASGAVVRGIPVADRRGARSRVARIVDAPSRRSFIALLADLPEAWELLYDPNAGPVFDGLVHDYRMGEGLASSGPLPVRRIVLDRPLDAVVFTPRFDYFVAYAAPGTLQVVSMEVRQRIETVELDGDALVERGVAWQHAGYALIALPDRSAPVVHVLDGRTWRWRGALKLPGRVARLRLADPSVLEVELEGGGVLRFALDRL